MCGRFTLARQDKREVAELLGVDESELGDYRPRYNIAPMQRHFLVVSEYERRKALPARWGLVNRCQGQPQSRAMHQRQERDR